MPILSLKFKKNKIADYQLEKGKSITIGRRGNNDIIIENLAVSGHHAKIDSVGDGFVLTDLQSKNGCFVNEQLVTSHWLSNGDIITIGKHTLVFNFQEGESKPQGNPGEMDQTMVMDTSSFRNMVAKNAPKMAAAPKAQTKQPIGLLSYLSGGDGEVAINKKLIKIGKDSSSDVVISGFGIGQTAATISMRPNGYYLSYVSGLSKVKVNGEAVKESILLKEFDVIELGSVKMQFFTKE
jgi:pSer/pThr/pTyr-binding forkhead associated (FHA) protein